MSISKFSRTDLAVEMFDPDSDKLPKGIKRKLRKSTVCEITEIIVSDEMAGIRIGKPKGRYVTIETDRLSAHPEDFAEQSSNIADEIAALIPDKGHILVAGLGNESITPDALGPKVAQCIIATRHIAGDNVGGELAELDLNMVSVLSTGVMGQTGIESSELVKAVCERIKPTCVIAVDALACSDISRLGTTIQLSDSGISPGSGVQNRRKELSRETLGIPVIAVGVPTVVDMHSIVHSITGTPPDKHLPNMMVTPRDIDKMIDRTAHLLAFSLNRAAQPMLSDEDILSLM
ncbi:MAG: GPR endopeptidase [Oscillospiraceae bacterium]|nr:GPR endopeptidase [Oscillospiraceae bacterium]